MTYRIRRQESVGWIVAFALLVIGESAGAGTSSSGAMSAVDRVIRQGTPKMLECYTPTQIFRRKHERVEVVDVHFTLEDTGTVKDARIRSSEIDEPKAEECILETLRGLPFPLLRAGESLVLNFPLRFRYSGNLVKDSPEQIAERERYKKKRLAELNRVNSKAKLKAKTKAKAKAKTKARAKLARKGGKPQPAGKKRKPAS